ncbi:Metallo-dependent phosphatase-like protein [Boletus reticuloceps]|uniref:Purple acid phosphatase n=1 Tax=Boletus reticuloceps TaxID=495285 RepID=A0A8I2YGF7_9AGAM|nr:Metallo-dependent phosphatase-like protein [Boletus reticuloceps]
MLQRTLVAAAVAFLGGVNAQIYLSNYSTPFSCLAESTGVHVPGTVPCNPVEPLQQHLAFAGPTGMTISRSTHSQLDNPQVLYGERRVRNLDHLSCGTTTSKSRDSNHGQTHNTGTVSLTLNEEFIFHLHFSFIHLNPLLFGRNCSGFVTDLGLMSADNLSTKVGLYGGTANPLGPNDLNTIQSLIENKEYALISTNPPSSPIPSPVLTNSSLTHFGDITYSDYFGNNSLIPNMTSVVEGYNVLFEQYYDQMTTLTSSKAYMANCDNGGTTDKIHNITYTTSICIPGQLNFTDTVSSTVFIPAHHDRIPFHRTVDHFRMPSEESGGVCNFWYSFNYGLAHFIVLNTETDLPVGLVSPDGVGGVDAGADNGPFGYPNEQYDWFEKDLASVDRDKTPWTVVGLHRPWYIGIQNNSSADVCLQCQQAFEPLMIKYGVDLHTQGHVHAYERNAPIANCTYQLWSL